MHQAAFQVCLKKFAPYRANGVIKYGQVVEMSTKCVVSQWTLGKKNGRHHARDLGNRNGGGGRVRGVDERYVDAW